MAFTAGRVGALIDFCGGIEGLVISAGLLIWGGSWSWVGLSVGLVMGAGALIRMSRSISGYLVSAGLSTSAGRRISAGLGTSTFFGLKLRRLDFRSRCCNPPILTSSARDIHSDNPT